jgi:tetrapyrrole methylase family protein/MazG family protein
MGPPMASPETGQRFVELLTVMARLRGPGGCPWDREQTPASLRPFLVEETYEVLEALDTGDPRRLMEELGDLLFQVVFHAQLAAERREFSMAELLGALIDKMVRRHPHVFADRSIGSAAEALSQWEAIKQAEGGPGRSALHGIPRSLPGLLRAQRIQHRASRIGFDWDDAEPALDKVREEVEELHAALHARDREATAGEVGDLLFAAVNVARLAGVDAEAALQGAVERFRARFQHMEAAADESGRELRSLTLDEMERLWMEAKARERRG